jgi:seryl-tRNA synthetase
MSSTDSGRLKDRLIAAQLLLPTNAVGVLGFGEDFVRVLDAVDAYVSRAGAVDQPELLRFPGLLARSDIERTDYLNSFPDLLGAIHSFSGDDAEHKVLLSRLEGGQDWSEHFRPTELMLVPAACYPIYGTIDSTLPPGGRRFEILGTCFRHEPSDDPARMVTFHQHEFVRIGDPQAALAFRDDWKTRATELMRDLGLDVDCVVANDPFFGRAGRLLAANQREEAMKYEVVATVDSETKPTAIASANLHGDHLTTRFGITTDDGATAHSACVGFGLERITLALFAAHGVVVDDWPDVVRDRLAL